MWTACGVIIVNEKQVANKLAKAFCLPLKMKYKNQNIKERVNYKIYQTIRIIQAPDPITREEDML